MMQLSEVSQILDIINNSVHQVLVKSLLNKAVRYSGLRCEWYFADGERRIEMDQERTLAHNAFISSCDILSRNMLQAGEDSSWRKKIGQDRKEIGDFACLLIAVIGIRSR